MTTILGIDVGLRNLAICRIQIKENSCEIIAWEVLDVLQDKKSKQISIQDGVNILLESLSNVRNDTNNTLLADGIDICCIESQPTGRMATGNTRMKVMSHIIQAFFKINMPTTIVKFINPKSKLVNEFVTTLLGDGEKEEKGDAATKKRYRQHKKRAIQACQCYLEKENQKWSEWYMKLPKKDDAADSFLIAYLGQGKKKNKKRKRK